MRRRGVDYSLFRGRVKLRALVSAVMNSWVPHDADYVWSSCEAHSFCNLPCDRSIASSKAMSPQHDLVLPLSISIQKIPVLREGPYFMQFDTSHLFIK